MKNKGLNLNLIGRHYIDANQKMSIYARADKFQLPHIAEVLMCIGAFLMVLSFLIPFAFIKFVKAEIPHTGNTPL